MKNCNTISIHEGMGTTQNERVRPALQTDFFLLDERGEEDFILFVQKLSKYVKFYNEFDISEGDWANFFQKESTSILIYIASWNIELLQNSFEIKKNEIYLNTDFSSQKNILLAYFIRLEKEFDDLLKRAKTLDDDIIEKENLMSSYYIITENFVSVFSLINNATDINTLLKNFKFIKLIQQLFGLLLSWKNFSENAIAFQLEHYSKHTPHYALYLSFLKLLSIAKDKFNEFTKKHLDFYYKEVLRVQNRNANPDLVHLVVEPFDVKPFLIPKDTIFLAGKNSLGQKKFFASTSDQTVNQIKLYSFLSYHRKTDFFYKTSDLLSVNAKNKGFDVFTNSNEEFKEGLMIASPILYMQSGERIIYLRFNDKNYNAGDFNFYITGEKKVIEIIDINKEELLIKGTNDSFIRLIIPSTEKSIIPFDPKIHTEFLVQTDFPVLKIIPQNRKVVSEIKKIDIRVKVNQFKSFVLESDFGIIDTEKPFYPFGEFPKNGNGITLSSNEFFMKNNAVASLSFTSDLNNNWINDKVNLYHLNNGYWEVTTSKIEEISNEYPLNEYHFDEVVSEEIVSNGKIRIELDYTEYSGETFMQTYIVESKSLTPVLPYKPRIKEFVFNYSVSETIDLTKVAEINKNNPVEIFHVLPYGYAKKSRAILRFSAIASNEGYIYFGFDKVIPNDGLSFLIQLEEGTANPLLEPATISWEYLSNNQWNKLDANAIGDETYSLTQSGLISVSIPEYVASTNTLLPLNLFWLRISISNIQSICKFLGIHVQAFKAVLVDSENIGAMFMEITPKETISKAYKTISGVKKIIQPYDSFGGRVAEIDETLYTRISERLRHKNRAITAWDYERIILEEFPEIFRVKVLNHYRYDTKTCNVSAGYVTLITIAKSLNSDNISWKPLLSLNKMLLIKKHLYKIASPHARICVKPPQLEKVEVQFKVKFHLVQGMDTRLYIAELKSSINKYLSPWAYDDGDDIYFANAIEFSSIIQLIDNQNYVDYITDFEVKQFILDENNEVVGNSIKNLNRITPQTDYTLFIPSETHQITDI